MSSEVQMPIAPEMGVSENTAVLHRAWPTEIVGGEACSVVDGSLDDNLRDLK